MLPHTKFCNRFSLDENICQCVQLKQSGPSRTRPRERMMLKYAQKTFASQIKNDVEKKKEKKRKRNVIAKLHAKLHANAIEK